MSRCRIVGAFLTSPMLPYATDNAVLRPPKRSVKPQGTRSDRPVPAPRQLVRRVVPDQHLAGVDPLAVQLRERTVDVPPHHTDGDPEDPLAALEQRVDLVGRGALVDRGAVAHQRHALQVPEAP